MTNKFKTYTAIAMTVCALITASRAQADVSDETSSSRNSAPAPAQNQTLKIYPVIRFVPGAVPTDDPLNLQTQANSPLAKTLEATFIAQLDELYRYYQPSVQRLQFVDATTAKKNYDLFLYGTFARRDAYEPGLLITLTLLNVKTKASQSFQAEGDGLKAVAAIAKAVFHDYQRTQFPTTTTLFGKSVELISRSFIHHPTQAPVKDLQQEARWACENLKARLPSENELKALAAKGDYNGGITLGVTDSQEGARWALGHDSVYVANGGWTSSASNLNPSEFISYLCLR